MKTIAVRTTGTKAYGIRKDPELPDTIDVVRDGDKVDVYPGDAVYGFRNRKYIRVRTRNGDGYIIKEAVSEESGHANG